MSEKESGVTPPQTAATAGAPTKRFPAEAWHPSVFIQEKLDARRWTLNRLAIEMGGEDWRTDRLALDIYFEVGPNNTNCYLGEEMSRQIGRAFGVSEKFFVKLEAAWREWKTAVEVADRQARSAVTPSVSEEP